MWHFKVNRIKYLTIFLSDHGCYDITHTFFTHFLDFKQNTMTSILT